MVGLVQGQNGDKRMEKQICCMSSFLQIFDRQQILAGKRIHSTKRLPPSTGVGASPETVSSGDSQEFSQEPEKHVVVVVPASPDNSKSYPAKIENCRPISPVLIPTFDNQSRPPSVIARLMGLEPLTSSDKKAPQTVKSPALPRSVDVVRSKYIDDNNFQVKLPNQSQNQSVERIVTDEWSNVSNSDSVNGSGGKSMEYASVNLKSESSRSFSHSADFFPEPNQKTVITNGDFEKKLKMRGMDEQFNDLSALEQILEVLQHKGLLHSTSRRSNRDSHRNFIYDRNLHSDGSSIHLKHWRWLASKVDQQRSVNDGAADRSGRIPMKARTSSPNRIESNLKSCNSIIKRKPLSIEIHSPIDSTKLTAKKHGSVHHSVTNRSPRNHKPTESSSNSSPKQSFFKNVVTDDESSSISTTDSEISKSESCREGNRLLERCGKLLHSIAEMNSTTESPPKSATVLPSPVSVLNSGFDKDESSSPSDSIDFKATPTFDFEDENWSPKISPTKHEEFISDDSDFIYISEILRASQYLRGDSDVFFSIEKRLYDTENTSNVSKRQRKLVFDVIVEILDRNRQLPPWKASIEYSRPSVKQIWSEFQKIREMNTGDSLMEPISGVLKKDLVEINGWGDYPIETSEAILDIERMIFKDLVGEEIGDLVKFSGECMFSRTRRRLVF